MSLLKKISLRCGGAASVLALAVSAQAATISGNTYSVEVDQIASSVSLVTGSFTPNFGPLTDSIDGDVNTGAINIGFGVVLDFGFANSVSNGAGDDLLLLDSRFDSADIEISLDGSAFFSITSEFVDTGIVEPLDGCCSFDLFEARVDLSDYGFSSGFSFDTLTLRTLNNGLDLMEVAAFSSVSTAPVPLPAGLPLMLVGLGAFAAVRRKTR